MRLDWKAPPPSFMMTLAAAHEAPSVWMYPDARHSGSDCYEIE
jgi:hypothetical protein